MKRMGMIVSTLAILLISGMSAASGLAQSQQTSALVSKSTKAVGYVVGGGSTKVDLKGTPLAPKADGDAKVEAQKGITKVEARVRNLAQPSTLGTEMLTYVLWVVTPDGSTVNIGEIQVDAKGKGELKTTTQLQTFSLIVTAEPYFAVRQPSELVVLENALRKDTKGKIFPINEYKLMKQNQYQKMGNPLALTVDLKKVPLELYEARNAVEIAKERESGKYAAEIMKKAEASLQMAENALIRNTNKKDVITRAREAVQFAEDARSLAFERIEAERIEKERVEAAARAKSAAEAKAAAEAAQAKRKADEEARRQGELAAAREAQMKAEAKAAAAKAEAEQAALRAKEEAAKAATERAKQEALRAEREKQALRASLLEQFNRILETRDTPRGLVVTMADVLFDTGKYDLRPAAREKLARLSGIVLSHPGLLLQVEGHTDSTGSDEFNQKLSEQRAGATRDFLIEQGLDADIVAAKGFGKNMPIADNSTADGRQKNRRVEIIVGGEVIGVKIGN